MHIELNSPDADTSSGMGILRPRPSSMPGKQVRRNAAYPFDIMNEQLWGRVGLRNWRARPTPGKLPESMLDGGRGPASRKTLLRQALRRHPSDCCAWSDFHRAIVESIPPQADQLVQRAVADEQRRNLREKRTHGKRFGLVVVLHQTSG